MGIVVTPAYLERFFTALDTSFRLQYANTPSWVEKISTPFPCSTEAWLAGWLTMIDKFRVWKGDRVVRSPAPQTYIIPMIPWELTEEIDAFKLADDLASLYAPLGPMIGEQGRLLPNYAMRDLLQGANDFAGAAQISLDGVTHWNSAHPVDYWDAGKGTYCNDFGTAGVSVNGITVGGTFSTNAYKTLREEMLTRKNESGEVDGVNPSLLMVPPQLETEAKIVSQSAYYSPAAVGVLTGFVGNLDNPFRNMTDLLMNPHTANEAATFYMFAAGGVIKPTVLVTREPVQIVPRTRPDDPVVFNRHTYQWGAWARLTPGWGPPRLASRSGIVAS